MLKGWDTCVEREDLSDFINRKSFQDGPEGRIGKFKGRIMRWIEE